MKYDKTQSEKQFALAAPTFKPFIEAISKEPHVRRVYFLEQREGQLPDKNLGYMVAIDAPEATDRQWSYILDLAKELNFEWQGNLVRLSETEQAWREMFLRDGILAYDQSDSPVSPT